MIDNNFQQNGSDNEIIVKEYFSRIRSRDIDGLLELFSDDAVIHEPFSRARRLFGKTEIKPFLKSVIMANEGLQYEINIERQKANPVDNFVAFVIFRKGNTINSRFTFSFDDPDRTSTNGKIKSLLIEFLD
ncbi:MAG TPA: nuclear transport factor 2 family protein [Nitrososphaeraceae archaeon]|nr:nuclear transport factor 2 family protein [Nitrososphaeraceae archaeon]